MATETSSSSLVKREAQNESINTIAAFSRVLILSAVMEILSSWRMRAVYRCLAAQRPINLRLQLVADCRTLETIDRGEDNRLSLSLAPKMLQCFADHRIGESSRKGVAGRLFDTMKSKV